MTWIDFLVWASFIGDVVFIVAYMALPPRDWWKYQMGWHLVSFMVALGLVLGTSSLRRVIGPIPLWATYSELSAVAAVIWWRTIWVLLLKLQGLRR